MTALVIRPVVGIARGHVAEAKRALAAQGRDVSDAAILAYLWTARALPVALDALLDQGASVPLADVEIVEARVQRVRDLDVDAAVAVGVQEEGALVVEVRVLPAEALDDASEPRDAAPAVIVRFGLAPRSGAAVHIQRFVVGRS